MRQGLGEPSTHIASSAHAVLDRHAPVVGPGQEESRQAALDMADHGLHSLRVANRVARDDVSPAFDVANLDRARRLAANGLDQIFMSHSLEGLVVEVADVTLAQDGAHGRPARGRATFEYP